MEPISKEQLINLRNFKIPQAVWCSRIYLWLLHLTNIEWDFIPEHEPHFGGPWEAAIRSCKKYLSHIVRNALLTQIETCLNSRPPTHLPDADDNVEALTPGHFLIGCALEALPDPNLPTTSSSSCTLITPYFKSTAWDTNPMYLECTHTS